MGKAEVTWHIPPKLISFRRAGSYYIYTSRHSHNPKHTHRCMFWQNLNDTQTGMLLGIPRSARCVQRFDDSLNSAIHITYRISLRSSSMREPRDPLLKVVFNLFFLFHSVQQQFMFVKKIIDNLDSAKLPTSSSQVERMKDKQVKDSVHMPLEASYNHLPPCLCFISIMILPQVHLRKPCYDFYFL